MDKKKSVFRTPTDGTLTKIPEVIDPGITIPIYEESLDSQLSGHQTQKLGSYRSRAGKFSNTLSNLLPSISAKLHHSKKNGKNLSVTDDESNNSSESTVDMKSKNFIAGLPLESAGRLTPPQEIDNLANFPDHSNNMLNQQPRTSNDFANQLPQQISRTRNSTISSQITSMSSIAQSAAPSNNPWGSTNANPLPTNDPLQQHILQQIGSNNNNNNNASLNDYTKSAYYDALVPSISNNVPTESNINTTTGGGTVVNNLTVPTSNNNAMWVNRQRSQSNTSSVYMDAQFYDQQQPARAQAVSNFAMAPQGAEPPLVSDEIDPRSINWVSMDPSVPSINQIGNLLPTNTISISNVYPLQHQQPLLNNAVNLTSTSLATLCSKFGRVISARTLKGIHIALVEFETVESALRALDNLQGKEVSKIGAPSGISFAKILPMHQNSTTYMVPQVINEKNGTQPLLQEQLFNGSVTFQQHGGISIPVFNQYHHPQQQQRQQQVQQQPPAQLQQPLGHNCSYSAHTIPEKEQCPFPLPPPNVKDQRQELQKIIDSFETKHDSLQIQNLLTKVSKFDGTSDTTNFGPLPEPLTTKQFDAPKLRELRKGIDSDSISNLELEQLALAMLDELPELSSDYLGNTIVQKLFECSSDIVKDIMLRKTSRYLTSMGVHKNGTWACQKMITMATSARQIMLVTKGIEKYCTPLFTDQFGNYVIQCVLKFGFPWNSFIFESIIANFWTIVQNRYGARAVRACVEAHDVVTTEQTLVLSSMIVLYAEYLATNSNGTLLLTWFLDTCVLPKRHSILVPRLTDHILDLCRHKLASLTILKILNFRGDDSARKQTLQAIFGDQNSDESPTQLQQILHDTNYGPTFIYKVLSMPLLEDDVRSHVINQVRKILTESPPPQQHRRLMEEVGLAPVNVQAQNVPTRHRKSTSHAFPPDSTANHIRGLSMSSVRSSGNPGANNGSSRASNLMPLATANQAAMTSVAPSPGNPLAYYNYPGVFPSGYTGSNTYLINNDELTSQLEMLNLNNNNTPVSLPKLSFTKSNTILDRSNGANAGVDQGAYGF